MQPSAPVNVLVFDAYGTLFDVESVQRACESAFPESGRRLSDLWRQKQLEYTWLTSLTGEYRDFWDLTEAALIQACGLLGLSLDSALCRKLLEGYLTLQAFPEVRAALEALHGRIPLAILSNGTPEMLRRAAEHSGMAPLLDKILSVDAVRIYKPSPSVYRLVTDTYRVAPHQVGFVSGNAWDAHGAKTFGFRVFWLNRYSRPFDPLGSRPDAVLSSLLDLSPHLAHR